MEKEAEEQKCCKKLSRSAVCALPYPATYPAIHRHPAPSVLVLVPTHTPPVNSAPPHSWPSPDSCGAWALPYLPTCPALSLSPPFLIPAFSHTSPAD